jgi:hypothetical protein
VALEIKHILQGRKLKKSHVCLIDT